MKTWIAAISLVSFLGPSTALAVTGDAAAGAQKAACRRLPRRERQQHHQPGVAEPRRPARELLARSSRCFKAGHPQHVIMAPNAMLPDPSRTWPTSRPISRSSRCRGLEADPRSSPPARSCTGTACRARPAGLHRLPRPGRQGQRPGPVPRRARPAFRCTLQPAQGLRQRPSASRGQRHDAGRRGQAQRRGNCAPWPPTCRGCAEARPGAGGPKTVELRAAGGSKPASFLGETWHDRLLLCSILALGLVACGGKDAGEPVAANEPAAGEPAPAVDSAAAPAPAPAEPAAAAPLDGEDVDEEVASVSPSPPRSPRRPRPSATLPAKWKQGTHFAALPAAQTGLRRTRRGRGHRDLLVRLRALLHARAAPGLVGRRTASPTT